MIAIRWLQSVPYIRSLFRHQIKTLFCDGLRLGSINIPRLEMLYSKGMVDARKLAILLQECGDRKSLSDGKHLHEFIIDYGFQDRYVENHVIQMYGKCGALAEARAVFDSMQTKNSFTWNIMIGAFAQHGQLEEALELFHQMPDRDVITWNAMIGGYVQHGHTKEAIRLFHEMPVKNVVSWNTMIALYAQQRQVADALALFQEMPSRNVVSWTTLMSAYVNEGHLEAAFQLFQQMPQRTVVSWTTMTVGYADHGYLKEALELFHQMPDRDVVSWTAIISAFAQQGHLEQALHLFHQMPQRDILSWNMMISACSQQGNFQQALDLFQKMPEKNIESWNVLISAFAQQGQPKEAFQVFLQMPSKNLVSWNVMISAFTQCGQLKEALGLFQQMPSQGMVPNQVTYVIVLDACAESSALAEGKDVHHAIMSHGLQSDLIVQTALVNMYAKCGSLHDIAAIFDTMLVQDEVSWAAIIAAYAQHGNADKALEVLQKMQQRKMVISHITVCSILSACRNAGFIEEACYCFISFNENQNVASTNETYNGMIGLLGHTEWLDEAESLLNNMPYSPSIVSWSSLLGSCCRAKNIEKISRLKF